MTIERRSPIQVLVSRALASATIITALLYYIGWARSQTIADELGYDASLLGLSAQDYILRAVQPLATLVLPIAGSTFALGRLHRELVPRITTGRLQALLDPNLSICLRWLGAGLAVVAVGLTPTAFGDFNLLLPLAYILAAGFLGYGSWLREARLRSSRTGRVSGSSEVQAVVGLLLVAATFLLATLQARASGRHQADENRDTEGEAVVTVLSAEPGAIPGSADYESGGRFLTPGLALIGSEGGYHLLIPYEFDERTNARVTPVEAANIQLHLDKSVVVPCTGFEDLEVGSRYGPGEIFVSGMIPYRVWGNQLGEPGDEPSGVEVGGPRGDLHLHLRNASIEPLLAAPYEQWVVAYRREGPQVALQVNGASAVAEDPVLLTTDAIWQEAWSADVTATGDDEGWITISTGSDPFKRMAMGGADLVLDC